MAGSLNGPAIEAASGRFVRCFQHDGSALRCGRLLWPNSGEDKRFRDVEVALIRNLAFRYMDRRIDAGPVRYVRSALALRTFAGVMCTFQHRPAAHGGLCNSDRLRGMP
jgi:hypothetical protein